MFVLAYLVGILAILPFTFWHAPISRPMSALRIGLGIAPQEIEKRAHYRSPASQAAIRRDPHYPAEIGRTVRLFSATASARGMKAAQRKSKWQERMKQ
jgi:hypothetical protein